MRAKGEGDRGYHFPSEEEEEEEEEEVGQGKGTSACERARDCGNNALKWYHATAEPCSLSLPVPQSPPLFTFMLSITSILRRAWNRQQMGEIPYCSRERESTRTCTCASAFPPKHCSRPSMKHEHLGLTGTSHRSPATKGHWDWRRVSKWAVA
jgi:hypothetical protein